MMRFEGTLTSWNDERGFGRIESHQGGEPIFVHVSAWPRGSGRPQTGQAVSFEVELGPKGKRAKSVQLVQARRAARPAQRATGAPWGTATLFAIPAFLVVYVAVAVVWKLPLWVAGLYLVLSAATYAAYAADKAAARSGGWRTPEGSLHLMAVAGGWPGALLAQQFHRHKSSKAAFRQVFWATVLLNVVGLVVLASPWRHAVLQALSLQ
jgi:uncharacterized membrane protein YsdA (DUF1294 family)/cold shock CspA family protein